MARPQSKEVHLYQKKGRPEWWARFSLPPNVARAFRAPDDLPDASRPPGKDGRVAFSLHTTDKRVANNRRLRLQARLQEAWDGKLNRHMMRKLLDESGRETMTLEELVAEIEKAEATKVARGQQCATPQERDEQDTIAPETAARYRSQRLYVLEAIAAVYPGRRFYVHQVGVQEHSPCDLRKIRAWLLFTRRLARETYNLTRSYWSGHWQHIVCAQALSDVNPWPHRDLRPPDPRKIARATLDAPQRALITALPSTWANNALKLLMNTGCRPVELCHWMRNRYDPKRDLWTVYMSKVGKDKEVPNEPVVADIIAAQVKLLEHLGLAGQLYLFPRIHGARRGEPSTRRQMAKAVTRALRKVVGAKTATGLSISGYAFRRTVASLRDSADVSPEKMAGILGHSNTDQQQIYMQTDTEALHDAYRRIQKKI